MNEKFDIKWIKWQISHLEGIIKFHKEKLKRLKGKLKEITGRKIDKVKKEENNG